MFCSVPHNDNAIFEKCYQLLSLKKLKITKGHTAHVCNLVKGSTDSTHGGDALDEQRVRGVVRLLRLQVLWASPGGLQVAGRDAEQGVAETVQHYAVLGREGLLDQVLVHFVRFLARSHLCKQRMILCVGICAFPEVKSGLDIILQPIKFS